jgi:hypothetical protein
LTCVQIVELLGGYLSGATYNVLSEKFGISPKAIGNIINGFTYREIPGIAHLREEAQKKAAGRHAKYSNAQAARVPDPGRTFVEVDLNSVASLDALMLRLQAARLMNSTTAKVAA